MGDKVSPQINVRGRVPMTEAQIEKGILLGSQLLKQQQLGLDTDFR